MTATPARIGFIQTAFRRVVAETPVVAKRYGALARDSDDPIETFFDNPADAQMVAEERQSILGTERRRFAVQVADIAEIVNLDPSGAAPVARYIDRERAADRPVIVSEILIDLARQRANLILWG